MNELQAAVCEDSKEDRDRLLACIRTAGVPVHCDIFPDGGKFLAQFRADRYDLIFMDIFMEGPSGVETVTRIRDIDPGVLIAFVTSSTDHALEGYRLNVVKYIEKPVSEKPVREFLEMARARQYSLPHLMLKISGTAVSVPFRRILYAEQKAHALLLHLTDGSILQANERLDEAEPYFDGRNFFRCHKSYLVNLAYVRNFDQNLMVFTMMNGENVHIRRESLHDARKAYESCLFDRTRKGTED